MNNKLAQTMQTFFKNVDKEILTDPTKLANAYANHFISNELNKYPTFNLPSDNINNVNIISTGTSLDFMTRRVPLIANTTVISHYGEKPHPIRVIDLSPDRRDYSANVMCSLNCPSIQELGMWLAKCKPLFESGEIFYFPDIRFLDIGITGSGGTSRENEVSLKPLHDVIIKNKKLVGLMNSKKIKPRLVRPILEIDLPFIDDVDLGTFAKITADEREAADRFRDFLRLKFLDLQQNEGSEHYETNITKIGVEIRDGVRRLNSDLNILKKKRAFQVTGAAIAATTALLITINSAEFKFISELLGTSGGLLAVTKAFGDHTLERKKIAEDSPYYYLWLLSKKKRK